MSVVQNPLIGRARQKLGGTVFTTWKGINVIKGKPLSVANPKTDGQLMRRSALTQIVAIGRTIAAALNFGFKEQAVRKSAFNAFTGYNLRNGFNYSTPPDAVLTPATMLVSQGTISSTPMTAATANATTDLIAVEWDNSALLPGQSNADALNIVGYNQTTDSWAVGTVSNITRDDEEGSALFPNGFINTGNTIRYYVFFYNSTNRKSSDSVTGTVVAS